MATEPVAATEADKSDGACIARYPKSDNRPVTLLQTEFRIKPTKVAGGAIKLKTS